MALKIKKICYNGKIIAPTTSGDISKLIYCIICGRVVPNPYIQSIKKVTYNGKVLWPATPSETLVIASYDNTVGLLDNTKTGYTISNSGKPLIKRVIYNGYVIWPSESKKYLDIEKEYVFLNDFNNYEDTNEVYTNTTFIIT